MEDQTVNYLDLIDIYSTLDTNFRVCDVQGHMMLLPIHKLYWTSKQISIHLKRLNNRKCIF